MSADDNGGIEKSYSKDDLAQVVYDMQQELIHKVLDELKKRYNRSFSITKIIYDPGIIQAKMIVHTTDNPKIIFFVKIDENGSIIDTFVRSLCLYTLTSTFEEEIPGSKVNAVIIQEDTQEEDTSLSLESYLKNHEVRRILLRVIIKKNMLPPKEDLLKLLERAGKFYDADIVAKYWVFDDKGFEECEQLFLNIPSVSEASIMSCGPISMFSAFVQNGIVRQTGKA